MKKQVVKKKTSKKIAIHKKFAGLKINFNEHRRYIRHPICYPLKYTIQKGAKKETSKTMNISEGGLMFMSKKPVKKGTLIVVELPFLEKVFKIQACVAHVSSDEKGSKLFTVGVSFHRVADALKVKLIEQLYLIDEYRHLRSIQLGRQISLEEASEEWIELYSKRFKKLYW